MILKAQEVYFALGTSIVNKYEDGMTNSGQQYGTHKAGCPWHRTMLIPAVRHVIFVFVHG